VLSEISKLRASTLASCSIAGLAFLLLAPAAARGQVVAHWSFDQQNGAVYPDDTGNHDATVVTSGTGAVTSGPGQFGNAAQFNNAAGGQATNNVFMTIPNLTEIMGPTGSSYSIAAWIQTSNTTSNNPVLADWGTAAAGTNRFVYWFSTQNAASNTQSQPRAQTRSQNVPSNADIIARQPAVNVADNVFHHVAWTFDKSTKVLTTYVDGVAIDSFTSGAANVDIVESAAPLGTIGRKSDTNNYFVGNMDELWVFNRVLTADEVSSLHTTNAIPEPASLAGLCVGAACALLRRRRAQ
jgi:hypothetical protein